MRFRTLLFLLITLALMGPPAGADSQTWTSTHAFGPTDSVSVAARPGLLLAAGRSVAGKPGFPAPPRTSGLFRSTDEGRTWSLGQERILGPDGEIELRPITETPTLLAAPKARSDAFAAFGAAVWRSEDDGATWSRVGDVGAVPTAVAFLADGRLVLGLTSGGLRASADRGETWAGLGASLPAARVNQIETVGAVFLVATEQGLYRSADSGQTFARVTTGLHQPENPAFGVAAAIVPEAPVPVTIYLARLGTASAVTAIYRSGDMGATWLLIAPMAWDAQLPRLNPGALAVATHLPNQFNGRSTALYAGGTSGLYFSLLETGAWPGSGPGVSVGAAGLDWVRIDPEPGRRGVRALAVADRNPGTGHTDTVYAAVSIASVYRAEFHGSESGFTAPGWYEDIEGGNTCLGMVARPDGALFIGCGRHVLRSDDGGATWRGAGNGLPYNDVVGAAYFPLVASADGSLWTSGFADGLYHSNPGVTDWSKVPFPGGSVGAVATHPTDPKVVYASGLTTNGCCRTVLQRSTDGGLTWLPVLETGDNIYTIAVSPHDGRKVLVAAFDEGTWLSEDAGATWSRVVPGTTSSAAFSSAQPGLAYVAGDAGLFRSTDSGRTWDLASASSGGSFPILSPREPDTLYVTSPTNSVTVSRDAGTTWSALGQGLPGAAAGGLAADPRIGGRVYVLAGFLSGQTTGASYWTYQLEGEA